ncbi:MAG: hypothetical protein ABSA42_08075 [Terracidiphilus sp.]
MNAGFSPCGPVAPVSRPAVVRASRPAHARSLRADSLSTRAPFEDWEQGRRRPDRAARAYLTVIARHPEAVVEALAS